MAAAPLSLALPPCPGCAGGGEVNGLVCGECGGSRRLTAARRRRRRLPSLLRVADVLSVPVGSSIRALPAAVMVAGVSLGLGEITGHVFGHGLTPWVTLLAVGVFGGLIDRQL